jgi:hypothetical protein
MANTTDTLGDRILASSIMLETAISAIKSHEAYRTEYPVEWWVLLELQELLPHLREELEYRAKSGRVSCFAPEEEEVKKCS